MQFAIGANGDLDLGDELGGGSAYSATGSFLGSFGLPEGYVNNGTAHPGGAR